MGVCAAYVFLCVSGHHLHLNTIMTSVLPTPCTHTTLMNCNHISGPLVDLAVWVGLLPLAESDCRPPFHPFSCTAWLMRNDPTNQCATSNREIKIKGLIKGHAVPTSLQPSCLDHYVMGGETQWF